MSVAIVPFSSFTYNYVRDLNYEWLQKYFSIEPGDRLQLENPEKEIVARGGHIFYAVLHKQVVATFSLLAVEPGVLELAKMATTEAFKGLGIGNKMLESAINRATQLEADKLILFSNTSLGPAIHLYKKFGFNEVPMGHSHYIRSDIRMEKLLKHP